MKLWVGLFALLTAALSAALVLQVRANRELRASLERVIQTRARESGFEVGQSLGPVTLRTVQGTDVPVLLDEPPGTVLLFFSSACDACEETQQVWRAALQAAGRSDVRVVCAQTDGALAHTDLAGLPPSLDVPLPPLGWLAQLPAVPATLVVDGRGRIQRAWFGLLEGSAREDLTQTVGRLGL